ncbi:MAG: ABC transporter ATP-binding protein [Acidimicrobiales bacterium]|nr:ABC transporter ATP-binding protein [Acidimicrobiales bacterium]
MSQTSSADHFARPFNGPGTGPPVPSSVPGGSEAESSQGDPGGRGSPAIHALGLHKRYGKTVAVASLSMSVGRGEVFGFLGPNGAGKTTVVKMLLGLVRPSGGEAMVLGAPIGDRETRRRIGYLPELFRFQPWLNAAEVLALHCRLLELPKRSWDQAVADSLRVSGLTDRSGDKVGGFSKGMQQRLGLGVALLGDPELVVLDEPTSALDPVGRHDMRQIIRGLRTRGKTVFLNTHLLAEAEQVCDRVAVLDKGVAIATGTLAELLGQHGRVRVKLGTVDGSCTKILSKFGAWQRDGDWIILERIENDSIPDLVAAIIGGGGRVEAVIPEHQSLEDRFLELLDER